MIHHRTAFMAHPSDELFLSILGMGHKGFPLPRFHIQLLTANCPTNRDHLIAYGDERWFRNISSTRSDDYAPPRIIAGGREDDPFYLTWQDWRTYGPEEGWSLENPGYSDFMQVLE